jgi:hypothetical protein
LAGKNLHASKLALDIRTLAYLIGCMTFLHLQIIGLAHTWIHAKRFLPANWAKRDKAGRKVKIQFTVYSSLERKPNAECQKIQTTD